MVQCTCTGASCSNCVPHKSPGPPPPPPAAPQPRTAMSPQSSNCCVNDTVRSPTAHPATGRSPVPTIQRPRAQLLSCHLFLCCLPPPLPPSCRHGHPSPPEDLLPATLQPHRFQASPTPLQVPWAAPTSSPPGCAQQGTLSLHLPTSRHWGPAQPPSAAHTYGAGGFNTPYLAVCCQLLTPPQAQLPDPLFPSSVMSAPSF